MASLPRIITVDPTWTIARIVRAAIDLMDRPIIQIDAPGGADALEEITRGGAALVITAWELYDDIKGPELALRIKQASPATAVVILADIDDAELDAETLSESPFVYMHRPVDIHQFLRVLTAGLQNQDIFEAMTPLASSISSAPADRGPVPSISVDSAQTITKRLISDVGAMAIILATRTGEAILEQGAIGYLNPEQLMQALMPMVTTNIDMGALIGGQSQTIQFYDGEDKDVFVFSVGLHYLLCVVFDGQAGQRQFGVVNTYGRRAVQDLIAMLGASAFIIEQPKPQVESPRPSRRRQTDTHTTVQQDLEPVAFKPEIKAPEEPELLKLDPIENFDLSLLDQLGSIDESEADDLFDFDKVAKQVEEGQRKTNRLDFSAARDLGILPDLGGGSI